MVLKSTINVIVIFHNLLIQSMQDWLLLLIVGVFVVIDLIILITYTVVAWSMNDIGLDAKEIVNTEDPEDLQGVSKEVNIKDCHEYIVLFTHVQVRQIITNYCAYVCDSRSRDIFLGVLYGYKALLQIMALLVAFSIRKVKVKGLNDTKFINAIVYVTSIGTAVIIVAAYTLKTHINSFAGLYSAGLFIGTTATLGLIFVPKVDSKSHEA